VLLALVSVPSQKQPTLAPPEQSRGLSPPVPIVIPCRRRELARFCRGQRFADTTFERHVSRHALQRRPWERAVDRKGARADGAALVGASEPECELRVPRFFGHGSRGVSLAQWHSSPTQRSAVVWQATPMIQNEHDGSEGPRYVAQSEPSPQSASVVQSAGRHRPPAASQKHTSPLWQSASVARADARTMHDPRVASDPARRADGCLAVTGA